MLGPRGIPLLPGGVVPVVAGQVELAEVQDRVPAVQLEPGVGDLLVPLGRGQVSLVVRVRQLPAGPGRRQPGEPGPDARRGQVLRLAVVLVPSGELTYLGDVKIADGAHPGGEIHAGDVTGRRAAHRGTPRRRPPRSGCASLDPLAG